MGLLRPLGSAGIASLETLRGGHSNTNIRVRRNGADDVVLRLYQRDPGQARKEAAIATLVTGKVPAPRYLHVGERENVQTYTIVEYVDGTPLQSRRRARGRLRWRRACAIAAACHRRIRRSRKSARSRARRHADSAAQAPSR